MKLTTKSKTLMTPRPPETIPVMPLLIFGSMLPLEWAGVHGKVTFATNLFVEKYAHKYIEKCTMTDPSSKLKKFDTNKYVTLCKKLIKEIEKKWQATHTASCEKQATRQKKRVK